MDLKKCISLIEEHISTIKKAMPTSPQSMDILRDIRVKLLQLIRSLFSDSESRIKDFNESVHVAAKREKLPHEYDEQAKVMISYLSAIKDELNLRMGASFKDEKLLSLKEEVEEKEIESRRREAVAETKLYGAVIEIIDRLRNELKDKSQLAEGIIFLKREIAEIKEILLSLSKKETGNSSKTPTE